MSSHPVVRVRAYDDGVSARTLAAGVRQVQADLGVTPDFPADVEEAARAAAASPRLPDNDRTDVELLTIDPAGSEDLDQAMHLARTPDGGFLVHYAIADVAAFVTPGDPVDREAHRRGQTLYGAEATVPLYPTVLSEGAASLLPGVDRPALLWTIRMTAEGERVDAVVERARVRSRQRLSYERAQALVEAGAGPSTLAVLADLGPLRMAREAARGGISLPLPEQDVDVVGDRWRLEHRTRLPVEEWNAQVSLLTGFAAAAMMIYAGVGLLRTLPDRDAGEVQRLHRGARALGLDWPAEMLFPDFVRTLDPARPRDVAMLMDLTRVLRGAGYVAFDGDVPAQARHAGLATEYAHVTAPLRRLGDRYAGEVCLSLCADEPVPAWVHAALPGLPGTLAASGRRAVAYERAVLDLVEAGVLARSVGETFSGFVVERDEERPTRGHVVISEPAVQTAVTAEHPLPLGERVTLRLVEADVEARRVRFELA
ncbi:RNB domain-containing ribonuclease [Nocardioides sp. GY 10127]|uniref:RNB domain-containing ribonuclease n=1 Tax=Nocardioides sp. GY 10127 TaxID=2569762 RepID=UPI0010A8C429|nr:RNB domain-containing ribonuclease [Nocardioides sp. GY 10127]TIC85702.1 RNB domain-containing ribonuclease [Nocardioides sp. GY 10127]